MERKPNENSKYKNPPHGHTSHGYSPTYLSWYSMKQRCLNPNIRHYEYYGGRGITVCERWLKFENFLSDMGKRPEGMTLDRYPNKDGNYEPGNCRWATRAQQQQNRRTWKDRIGEKLNGRS